MNIIVQDSVHRHMYISALTTSDTFSYLLEWPNIYLMNLISNSPTQNGYWWGQCMIHTDIFSPLFLQCSILV